MEQKVTLDTIVMDVLRMNRGTAVIFMNAGMHCIGCPVAANETVAEACAVHGVDPEKMVAELNAYLERTPSLGLEEVAEEEAPEDK